jgi:hypothetical protein
VAPIGPASAAYATVVIALLVVYFVMGISEIYIMAPTPAERIVLAANSDGVRKTDGSGTRVITTLSTRCATGELTRDGLTRFLLVGPVRESLQYSRIQPSSVQSR